LSELLKSKMWSLSKLLTVSNECVYKQLNHIKREQFLNTDALSVESHVAVSLL